MQGGFKGSRVPTMSDPIPNLPTELIPIDRIIPAPYNPRVPLEPEDFEYKAIKALLLKFGYAGGMVWNKRTGHCVSGNQRLKIFQELGAKMIEVKVVDPNEKDEMIFNVGLNRSGSVFDRPKLAEVDVYLDDGGMDMILTAQPENEIIDLIDYQKKVGPVARAAASAKVYEVVVACEGKKHQLDLQADLKARGYRARARTTRV